MSNILQRVARGGSALSRAQSAANRAMGTSAAEEQPEDDAEGDGTDPKAEGDDPDDEGDGDEPKADAEGDDSDPKAEGDEPDDGDDGEDDDAPDKAAAASAATARCQAIITSKAGMANPALAHTLAFEADAETGVLMSASQAQTILKAAGPAKQAGGLAGKMGLYAATPGPDANAGKGGSSDPVAVAGSLFGKRKAARAARTA